jgi:beta-glucanase (GH16 family)
MPKAWDKTFEADFSGKPLGIQFETTYSWGGRTNAGNKELELYVDGTYTNKQGNRPGRSPFAVKGGELTITAETADPTVFDGFAYTSGILTTHNHFTQIYGGFEMVAKIPAGQGLWPAFWLLPETSAPPTELDVMEIIGSRTNVLKCTVHDKSLPSTQSGLAVFAKDDLSKAFHSYALRWTKTHLTWYLDEVPVYQVPTPPDLNQPMYLLVNLAVGGTMPGSPDATTPFPAHLVIASIKAWYLPPDQYTAKLD